MYDPNLVLRLAQLIYAERLVEAEQTSHRRPRHQPVRRTQFGQRVGSLAGGLLVTVGQRLKG